MPWDGWQRFPRQGGRGESPEPESWSSRVTSSSTASRGTTCRFSVYSTPPAPGPRTSDRRQRTAIQATPSHQHQPRYHDQQPHHVIARNGPKGRDAAISGGWAGAEALRRLLRRFTPRNDNTGRGPKHPTRQSTPPMSLRGTARRAVTRQSRVGGRGPKRSGDCHVASLLAMTTQGGARSAPVYWRRPVKYKSVKSAGPGTDLVCVTMYTGGARHA